MASSRKCLIKRDIEAVEKACKEDKNCPFHDFKQADHVLSFTFLRTGKQPVHYVVNICDDYPDNTVISCSEKKKGCKIVHRRVPLLFEDLAKECNNMMSVPLPPLKLQVARTLSGDSHKLQVDRTLSGDSHKLQVDRTFSGDSHYSDCVSDMEEEDDFDYYYGQDTEGTDDEIYPMHPLLSHEIDQVRNIYGESAVGYRLFGSIDDVDVEFYMDMTFLDEEIARAWNVLRDEPIVIRLHISVTKYLDATEPKVEVFQHSKKDKFGLGSQLRKIFENFIQEHWKGLSNESVQKQHTVPLPVEKSHSPLRNKKSKEGAKVEDRHLALAQRQQSHPANERTDRAKAYQRMSTPEMQLAPLDDLTLLPTSTESGKSAKRIPGLEFGFLVQLMRYARQRIPTLNEYCVVCDNPHVFQNGAMLKPAVCSRELCVFAFQTLGVMSDAAEDIATGAEVVDLLVAMAKAALKSLRKTIIFEPFPTIVDPRNPTELALGPKKKDYARVERLIDQFPSTHDMTRLLGQKLKVEMDKRDVLGYPLLQWIISSNRSHIVKLPQEKQISFMHTPHQFLLWSSPPAKEAIFRSAREKFGSTFAFHGSHIDNWHSIMRSGLINASGTKHQVHGAAYGNGIYLSPHASVSFNYSGMGHGSYRPAHKNKPPTNGTVPAGRFLKSRNLTCIALCEVIMNADLKQHGNIWVAVNPDHVCTRFFFVYEDGQIGDSNIDTQLQKYKSDISKAVSFHRIP
ncbi:protein mono-ADP-ribosyltransferase PARP6-like isoform X2 [Lineus longissimus]|uniref:protein mono-ADP-ribosyltransferase PARP6-like isoform X2 n=1 Tax=Lineus longissimus TaxID=88925 RepID=UPI00315D35D6